ncbi:cell surface protein [Clostridiales bacterium]|nr:cell surface protein [Clostridiales bacterium]
MELKLKIFIKTFLLFVIVLIAVTMSTASVKAKACLLDWNLVDSGKYLDVDGNSKYMGRVWAGKDIWNKHKKGVIRKDSATRMQDLFVSDINKKNGKTGSTTAAGKMRLNKYYLENATVAQRTNTATHELGHTLGLEHSTEKGIMGVAMTSRTTLSKNDKDSYNEAYKKY